MAQGRHIVVVGGLAAGMSAAGRARRLDLSARITILEASDRISYGICGLPYLISGEISKSDALIFHTPESLKEERGIEAKLRSRVTTIRSSERRVEYERDGERKLLSYDNLILATGAKANMPIAAPERVRGLFKLRNLDDALAIKEWIAERKPQRAVVLGGGILGLEIADVLSRLGIGVGIFERAEQIAPGFDSEIATAVARHLHEHNVSIHPNKRIDGVEIEPENRIIAATGVDDEILCDMIVVAAGVQPNTRLAAEAGIRLDRFGAIVVDERMETSCPGIFAAGDCIAVPHAVSGKPYYAPTATAAVKCGRIAGSNAVNRYEAFPGALGTQAISLLGLELGRTGLSTNEARALGYNPVAVEISAQPRASYMGRQEPLIVRLIAGRANRCLIGAQLFGPGAILRLGTVATAIAAEMKPEELANLDLPYAPHVSGAWDPLIIAARELSKKVN